MENKTFATIVTVLVLLAMSAVSVSADELPSTWDWRDVDGVNYVTPVKSQRSCGACYAFAAVAGLESLIMTNTGIAYDLSEEQAKMCGGGCSGGISKHVFNMLSINGIVSEEDCPYHAYNAQCNETDTPMFRVSEWRELHESGMDKIKLYIYKYGNVVATVSRGHSAILIGWNDTKPHDNGVGMWIYKNSLGPYCCDDGFWYREYGTYTENAGVSVTGYEPYDANIRTVTNAEACGMMRTGYHPSDTAWGMSLLNVSAGEGITKIEFVTTAPTSDVDLYIYDGYDGNSLGNLLYSVSDMKYDAAGLYSVDTDHPLIFDADTEVAVVGRFVVTEPSFGSSNRFCPISIEYDGEDSGKTYTSPSGEDGTWKHAESMMPGGDVSLRLRVTDDPTTIRMATVRGDLVTIRGSGFGDDKSDWSNVTIRRTLRNLYRPGKLPHRNFEIVPPHPSIPVRIDDVIDYNIVSWDDTRIVVECPSLSGACVVAVNTLHGRDTADAKNIVRTQTRRHSR